MSKIISDELVEATSMWMRGRYHQTFKEYKEKFGTVSPVIPADEVCPAPWPVHFREGMVVRNFMRTSGCCQDWNAHDYDEKWVELVEKCLAH